MLLSSKKTERRKKVEICAFSRESKRCDVLPRDEVLFLRPVSSRVHLLHDDDVDEGIDYTPFHCVQLNQLQQPPHRQGRNISLIFRIVEGAESS